MSLLNNLPKSFAGIDYQPLQDLLIARQWQAADELTHQLILGMAGREGKWLREFDILCLPGADLKIIDRLWRAHSHNRFGFTIQYRSWDNRRRGAEKLEYFASHVGWLVHPDPANLKYNSVFERNEAIAYATAPHGHLPTTFALGGGKMLKPDPSEAWKSGERESEAFVGKDLLACFLERVHTLSEVADGQDFPTISMDRSMNRRQEHETIQPESEAIALLDHLPKPSTHLDYQPLHSLLAAGNWQQANQLTRKLILELAER